MKRAPNQPEGGPRASTQLILRNVTVANAPRMMGEAGRKLLRADIDDAVMSQHRSRFEPMFSIRGQSLKEPHAWVEAGAHMRANEAKALDDFPLRSRRAGREYVKDAHTLSKAYWQEADS